MDVLIFVVTFFLYFVLLMCVCIFIQVRYHIHSFVHDLRRSILLEKLELRWMIVDVNVFT